MFKVIITDSLNRDYKPQSLVTMSMSEFNATTIADNLNKSYGANSSNYAKVVPAEQPLNLESHYDLVGGTLPYGYWLVFTGAEALPEHVAKYWYETTILNKLKA